MEIVSSRPTDDNSSGRTFVIGTSEPAVLSGRVRAALSDSLLKGTEVSANRFTFTVTDPAEAREKLHWDVPELASILPRF